MGELWIKAEVIPWMIDSERHIAINTIDGPLYAVYPKSQCNGQSILGWEIERKGDCILIELARETDCGLWRCWISEHQIIQINKRKDND